MPETLTDAQKVLRNDTGKRIAVALEALASEVTPSGVIAPEYDPTATYAVGDMVIFRSVLYRCTTAITTPEEWTAAHWTATMVSDAYRQAVDQDAIDANLMALGLTGASVGDLVRVASVDATGKPTSWRKAPLCEIKTNLNLLDNWDFVGGGSQRTDATGCFPINQRGLRIYSGYGYSIDRWLVGSSLQVDDGYITIPAGEYFIQKLEPALFDRLVGLAVTASILLTGNVLLSGTAVINANYDTYFYQSDSVSLYTGISSKAFSVYAPNGLSILAVKLELGTEQTLAHQENGQWVLNEIPDYVQELAKCQRYYLPDCGRLCNAYYYGDDAGVLDILIPTPVTMIDQITVELKNSDYVIRANDNTILPVSASLPVSVVAINANAVIVRLSNLAFGTPFTGISANTVINLKSTT